MLQLLCAIMLRLSVYGQPAFITNGLVAHYPFNEDGRNLAANFGEITNCVLVSDRIGAKMSKSLLCNGVNLYSIPRSEQFTNSIFSVCLWYKPYSGRTPWNSYLISKDSKGNPYDYGRQWGLIFQSTNNPNSKKTLIHYDLWTRGSPVNWLYKSTVDDIRDDWNQICLVWDGFNVMVYSNGKMVNKQSAKGVLPPGKEPIRLGASSDKMYMFVGQIDDVRIYDRALTESEVKMLFNYELTVPLTVNLAVDLEFESAVDIKYQLESSNDLETWTQFGEMRVGTGNVQNYFARISKTEQFWRLKVVK